MRTIEDILRGRTDAPHNRAEALAYARKLYGLGPTGLESPHVGPRLLSLEDGDVALQATDRSAFEWCGEATHGLLDAALHSTLLSQADKDEVESVIDAARPVLERSKRSGHFEISWTETSVDPDHNVTEADIDLTLVELNAAYAFYDNHLRAPQSDGSPIRVSVYYDAGLHGSTSSHSNHVFLNSLTVISDDCRRRTTTAHELFHRVEYRYGYVTGTPNQRWWVEALGSWSQDMYADDIKDYIHRVNAGIRTPQVPLGRRSYDACHFWKLLSEQVAASASGPASELEAIRHFLEAYESAGTDAVAGVSSLTTAGLGVGLDGFYERFGKANFVKDLSGAPAELRYDDNAFRERHCGRWNGPFRRVFPVFDEAIDGDESQLSFGPQPIEHHASIYGALQIGSSVTGVRLRVTPGGGARLSAHLVSSLGDEFVRLDEQCGFTSSTDISTSFPAGSVDTVTLVVNGLVAGDYGVEVNP